MHDATSYGRCFSVVWRTRFPSDTARWAFAGDADLGRMIANATRYTETAPHAIIALSLATFGIALVGDALRRRFDPARRRMAL